MPWQSDDASPVGGDSQPDFLQHIVTYPYVRLQGLKAAGMNGRAGTIISQQPNGRLGVILHDNKKSVSLNPCNLIPYHFQDSDCCLSCNGTFNLCAFPPCDCSTKTGGRDDNDNHIASGGVCPSSFKMHDVDSKQQSASAADACRSRPSSSELG